MGFIYMMKSRHKNGATKVYEYQEDGTIRRVSSYQAGSKFLTARLPKDGEINCLDDLVDILKSAADEPDWFAVRGELRSQQQFVDNVNRRYLSKHDDPHWMEPPSGQDWMLIDIDGMPMPDWCKHEHQYGQLGMWVHDKLPEPLRQSSSYYKFSSSAGLAKIGDEHYKKGMDTIRIHLWFVLDRHVCSYSLRKWIKSVSSEDLPIDYAPFNPVQPHYTANPVFIGGPDPLKGMRSGYISSKHRKVPCPDEWLTLEEWEQQNAKQQSTVKMFRTYQSSSQDTSYCEAALQSAVREIESAREGTRHSTVFSQSASIGELVHRMDNVNDVYHQLVSAAKSVVPSSRYSEMERTVREGLETGMDSPSDRGLTPTLERREVAPEPPKEKEDSSMYYMRMKQFVEKCKSTMDDCVAEVIDALPRDSRKWIYTQAESYYVKGWPYPVKGPINRLDAVLVALSEFRYGKG